MTVEEGGFDLLQRVQTIATDRYSHEPFGGDKFAASHRKIQIEIQLSIKNGPVLGKYHRSGCLIAPVLDNVGNFVFINSVMVRRFGY